MNRPILFLLFLTGFALCYNGIGDRLLYNAFSHSALPLTVNDATNAGWAVFNSSCDSYRGIEYAKDGGPTHSFPITLYFTSGGQISGFAITIWGSYYPATYSDYYFFEPIGDGVWKISLSFRAPSMMCSGAVDSTTPVGDRVVLSQGIENLITPLTPEVAAQKLWTSGGCIGGMGRHWGYDLRTAPQISNIVSNLVPIMPMYNNDAISAVLISINATERVYPFGSWEGPFIPSLFCYNLCEAGCTFDTDFFSTMHFFFTDPNLNKCESHCPTKVESVVIN